MNTDDGIKGQNTYAKIMNNNNNKRRWWLLL
jgi:hypothetical protein